MGTQDTTKSDSAFEVKRTIKIPALRHAADAMAVKRGVGALSGVRNLVTDVRRHEIVVRYDARQTAYQTIEEGLTGVGYPPLDSWWSRVKGGWFQFSDCNARDNAKAPPPAGCNRPPK